jgi:hypothetical protein
LMPVVETITEHGGNRKVVRQHVAPGICAVYELSIAGRPMSLTGKVRLLDSLSSNCKAILDQAPARTRCIAARMSPPNLSKVELFNPISALCTTLCFTNAPMPLRSALD